MRDKSSPFIVYLRLEANTVREQMQSFALAVAKLCDGTCKALRGRMQCFASEMGKVGTEIVSPIPDKIKWRKDSPHMAR